MTILIDDLIPVDIPDEPAVCADNDPEMWFPTTPADVDFAKALCRTCPAMTECLAGAIERQEPWGVWGGELFEHGQIIAKKRGRGRPRKGEAA